MAAPVILDVKEHFGAVGDGCADDTSELQAAFAGVAALASSAGNCLATGLDRWGPYTAALRFPAGLYRITDEIRPGRLNGVRIFGEASRGGTAVGNVFPPFGAVIRQDADDTAILRFDGGDSWGVTIERLGFTWKNQQFRPGTWESRLPGDEQDPSYTTPGAVAMLFSGPAQPPSNREVGFFHFRITECDVAKGWRGIAIDDTYDLQRIALWGTQIGHCLFRSIRGAAISLVNHPDQIIGMPGNALRSVFVENYTGPSFENEEEQIRLLAQLGMTISGLDLEATKTRAIVAVTSHRDFSQLYLEHVAYQGVYPALVYFIGGAYSIRGLSVDGWIRPLKDPDDHDRQSSGTVVKAQQAGPHPTSVVVSGVNIVPADPSVTDPDAGGFMPRQGPVHLMSGDAPSAFTLVDRPNLPVYSQAVRDTWEPPNPTDMDDRYEVLEAWSDDWGSRMTAAVRAPIAKASRTLDFGTVGAGAIGLLRLGECVGPVTDHPELAPVPGAKPGDIVTLGPPANLPAGLVATGVVLQPGCVEIRLLNTTGSSVDPPSGRWTLEIGGGQQSGAAQEIADPNVTIPIMARPKPWLI